MLHPIIIALNIIIVLIIITLNQRIIIIILVHVYTTIYSKKQFRFNIIFIIEEGRQIGSHRKLITGIFEIPAACYVYNYNNFVWPSRASSVNTPAHRFR